MERLSVSTEGTAAPALDTPKPHQQQQSNHPIAVSQVVNNPEVVVEGGQTEQ